MFGRFERMASVCQHCQWPNYPDKYAPWRQDLGIASIGVYAVLLFIGVPFFLCRRHSPYVAIRQPGLSAVMAFGTLLGAAVPLREWRGEGAFPCWLMLSVVYIFVWLFALGLMLKYTRILVMHRLQRRMRGLMEHNSSRALASHTVALMTAPGTGQGQQLAVQSPETLASPQGILSPPNRDRDGAEAVEAGTADRQHVHHEHVGNATNARTASGGDTAAAAQSAKANTAHGTSAAASGHAAASHHRGRVPGLRLRSLLSQPSNPESVHSSRAQDTPRSRELEGQQEGDAGGEASGRGVTAGPAAGADAHGHGALAEDDEEAHGRHHPCPPGLERLASVLEEGEQEQDQEGGHDDDYDDGDDGEATGHVHAGQDGRAAPGPAQGGSGVGQTTSRRRSYIERLVAAGFLAGPRTASAGSLGVDEEHGLRVSEDLNNPTTILVAGPSGRDATRGQAAAGQDPAGSERRRPRGDGSRARRRGPWADSVSDDDEAKDWQGRLAQLSRVPSLLGRNYFSGIRLNTAQGQAYAMLRLGVPLFLALLIRLVAFPDVFGRDETGILLAAPVHYGCSYNGLDYAVFVGAFLIFVGVLATVARRVWDMPDSFGMQTEIRTMITIAATTLPLFFLGKLKPDWGEAFNSGYAVILTQWGFLIVGLWIPSVISLRPEWSSGAPRAWYGSSSNNSSGRTNSKTGTSGSGYLSAPQSLQYSVVEYTGAGSFAAGAVGSGYLSTGRAGSGPVGSGLHGSGLVGGYLSSADRRASPALTGSVGDAGSLALLAGSDSGYGIGPGPVGPRPSAAAQVQLDHTASDTVALTSMADAIGQQQVSSANVASPSPRARLPPILAIDTASTSVVDGGHNIDDGVHDLAAHQGGHATVVQTQASAGKMPASAAVASVAAPPTIVTKQDHSQPHGHGHGHDYAHDHSAPHGSRGLFGWLLGGLWSARVAPAPASWHGAHHGHAHTHTGQHGHGQGADASSHGRPTTTRPPAGQGGAADQQGSGPAADLPVPLLGQLRNAFADGSFRVSGSFTLGSGDSFRANRGFIASGSFSSSSNSVIFQEVLGQGANTGITPLARDNSKGKRSRWVVPSASIDQAALAVAVIPDGGPPLPRAVRRASGSLLARVVSLTSSQFTATDLQVLSYHLIYTPAGRSHFVSVLQREFCLENLMFLLDALTYRRYLHSHMKTVAKEMHDKDLAAALAQQQHHQQQQFKERGRMDSSEHAAHGGTPSVGHTGHGSQPPSAPISRSVSRDDHGPAASGHDGHGGHSLASPHHHAPHNAPHSPPQSAPHSPPLSSPTTAGRAGDGAVGTHASGWTSPRGQGQGQGHVPSPPEVAAGLPAALLPSPSSRFDLLGTLEPQPSARDLGTSGAADRTTAGQGGPHAAGSAPAVAALSPAGVSGAAAPRAGILKTAPSRAAMKQSSMPYIPMDAGPDGGAAASVAGSAATAGDLSTATNAGGAGGAAVAVTIGPGGRSTSTSTAQMNRLATRSNRRVSGGNTTMVGNVDAPSLVTDVRGIQGGPPLHRQPSSGHDITASAGHGHGQGMARQQSRDKRAHESSRHQMLVELLPDKVRASAVRFASRLAARYIRPDAELCVNIPAKMSARIMSAVSTGVATGVCSLGLFFEAEREILALVTRGPVQRFVGGPGFMAWQAETTASMQQAPVPQQQLR